MSVSIPRGRLNGRRAIVTGGSRGIGAAIVEAFIAEGAAVAFCHVNDADEAARTIEGVRGSGPAPTAFECDVSSVDAVAAFVARGKRRKAGLISWSTTPASASVTGSRTYRSTSMIGSWVSTCADRGSCRRQSIRG